MEGDKASSQKIVHKKDNTGKGHGETNSKVLSKIISFNEVTWIQSELMNYGLLPYLSPVNRMIKHLPRVVQYCRNKSGVVGYPEMSFGVWRHLACSKFGMDPEVAWTYFQLGHLLLHAPPSQGDAVLDCQQFQAELDNATGNIADYQVDSLGFIIFLYLQQTNNGVSSVSKDSLAQDEWPSSYSKASQMGRKVPDEWRHIEFVRTHLAELVNILMHDEDKKTGQRDRINVEVVQALRFLIGVSYVKRSNGATSLEEVLADSRVIRETNYDPRSRTWSRRSVVNWICSRLGPSPLGVLHCISRGRRPRWALGMSRREVSECRLACSPSLRMTDSWTLVVISQLRNQTVAQADPHLFLSNVRIHRATGSQVYLLNTLRSVLVYKCINTTVVLGPVEQVVLVKGCRNCVIITPCRQIIVSDSEDTTLHVLTPRRPLLMGSQLSGMLLAPYNTHYGSLETDMDQAHLLPWPNLWDQPIRLCESPSEKDAKSSKEAWKLLSPSLFYIFNIPFKVKGYTNENPFNLPPQYKEVVKSKNQKLVTWMKTVQQSQLKHTERLQLDAILQERFKKWLLSTGKTQQLEQLAHLAEAHNSSQDIPEFKASKSGSSSQP